MSTAAEAKKIVIKVGTSTLAHATGHINIRMLEELVKVLADLQNSGRQIILVSSGAIGAAPPPLRHAGQAGRRGGRPM